MYIFKISRGSMPPDPPSWAWLRHAGTPPPKINLWTRPCPASVWGQQVPHNGCCVGKGPVSIRPESCLGHTQQTAVPRAESAVRLVPLQQTTEIMRSKAVQEFVREDQDLVVHTGRRTQGASAAPYTQVSYAKTWAWASGFWRHCSGCAAACRWETGWLHREERRSSRREMLWRHGWVSASPPGRAHCGPDRCCAGGHTRYGRCC